MRHHPMRNCLHLILRVFTAGATAAAVAVILRSTQTVPTPLGPHTARWRDFPAFQWFVFANAIVFIYAVLGTIVACVTQWTRRGPLSYTKSAWLTFFSDFLLSCALMSACSTALGVAWIGKHGQETAYWNAVCPMVGRFCDQVQGALIACVCAFVCLSLCTVMSASALHQLAPHKP